MEFDHLVIHTKTKQQPSTTISLLASLYQIVVSPFKPNIVWDSNTNDKSLLDLTAMHNLYRNQRKNTDASELRIIDYRNGKYQGTTTAPLMTREGVGMVLDHNYLFAIAAWKQGTADGPAFIVFPDCTLFFGFLKGKLPVGIGCYQVSGKTQIYSLIGSGEEDLFVLDDSFNKNMILIGVGRQIMQSLYEEPTANQHLLKESAEKTKVNVRKEVPYGSAQEKWQIIEGFFKTVYMNQLKSIKEFVRHHFQTQVKANQPRVEIVQTKEQLQLNYQNSTIMCKIAQNSDNQADYRIRLLGYYNHRDNQYEISRKVSIKGDHAEENIESFRSEYALGKRSAVCMKHAHTYYQKSLNFLNDFLQIDYLYRVKFIYHSIQVSIGEFAINKKAQRLLQSSPKKQNASNNERHQERRHLHTAYEETVSKDHLSKAKEDIYKAVKSRSQSRAKSTSNSQFKYHAPQKFEISRVTEIPQRQKEYLQPRPAQGYSTPTPSPGKRSYAYLQQPNNRGKTFKVSPNKYDYTKEFSGKKALNTTNSKPTKFKYLDSGTGAKRAQNLTALTNYYEQIENQLRKQTPKTTQRKFRNIDGATSNKYNYGGNNEKYMKAPQQEDQKQPVGSRRVFKYGWE